MNGWLRRLGSVLLSGVEVLLALAVLFAVGVLFDIQAGVESGAYNPEAAGGFTIGFLAVWFVSFATLSFVAVAHAAVRAYLAVEDRGRGAVRDAAVRVVAELLLAAAILVGLSGVRTSSGGFDLLLLATAVVALGLVVHVAADAVLFARKLALGG